MPPQSKDTKKEVSAWDEGYRNLTFLRITGFRLLCAARTIFLEVSLCTLDICQVDFYPSELVVVRCRLSLCFCWHSHSSPVRKLGETPSGVMSSTARPIARSIPLTGSTTLEF